MSITQSHVRGLSSPQFLRRARAPKRLTLPRAGRVPMASESPTIVVVEDDAGMGQAIERVLQAGGFKPVLFASAEAALEAALEAGAAEAADALVLDIHLPGITGLELYRRLVLSGKAIPVIFITARDEPATRSEAESLGGAGSYLPKPFSGHDLIEAVTRILR